MRLSDVLGDGWENHVDGRPLKAVCDELLRNLDTQRLGCLLWFSIAGFAKGAVAETTPNKKIFELFAILAKTLKWQVLPKSHRTTSIDKHITLKYLVRNFPQCDKFRKLLGIDVLLTPALTRVLRTKSTKFWRPSAFSWVATEFSSEEKAFLSSGTGLEGGWAAPHATRWEAVNTVWQRDNACDALGTGA